MTDARVAAGRVDITPERPLPLAGYADRRGPSAGVRDPLEINAVLLEAAGRRVALLSLDTLFLTAELKQEILERAGPSLGLDAASLFCIASHTHTAPALDPSKPRLGLVDPAYLAEVARRAQELLFRIAARPAVPCRLSYRSAATPHAINRRRRGWQLSPARLPRRGVIRAPDPAGPRDDTLHLFRWDEPGGQPVAVLWSYACHPTAVPTQRHVSADFPGTVRAQLRHALGAALPVLFAQGCAGDVRPRELAPARTPARRLAELVLGKLFTPFTEQEYVAWAGSLAGVAVRLATDPAGRTLDAAPRGLRADLDLARVLDGAPAGRRIMLQRLELGPDARLLAVAAEPVADYGLALRAGEPGIVVPAGYIDTVFGYLPSARMLGEHGYEDEGFMESFGLSGRFRSDAEGAVMTALRALG